MSQIRTQINRIFSNDKVGDLFVNSDGGQGMIDSEVDRRFFFKEIKECLTILAEPQFLRFLNEHESYPNIKQFFNRLQKRMLEVLSIYENSTDSIYILEMIKTNRIKISKKYPNIDGKNAQIMFAKEYLKKHKSIENHTFEYAKDFF